MMRHFCFWVILGVLFAVGCGGNSDSKSKSVATNPEAKQTGDEKNETSQKPKTRRRRFRFKTSARFRKFQKEYDKARQGLPDVKEDPNTPAPKSSRAMSEELAVERLGAAILDSVELRSTLVIWLVDASASARNLRERTTAAIRNFYATTAATKAKKKLKHELLTAVAAYGNDVQWVVETPVGDLDSVGDAFDKIVPKSSNKENTFAALQASIEKYGSYTSRRYETMIVVISDEAGDDAVNADQIVSQLKKKPLLVYTIGVPAAFGRKAAVVQSVEGAFQANGGKRGKRRPSMNNVVQGPESRHREFIEMPFWGNRAGVLIDAGFGPFGLERVCRESGGRFIAIRRESFDNAFPATVTDSWPTSNALVCDPAQMRQYAPDYISEMRYQKLLLKNKARLALHKAAKFPIGRIPEPLLTFEKGRSEAEFSRRLTRAQQLPAIVQPQIERLFAILRQGEADRLKLKSPRWQAAYDLAMGRVLAMKVRIEGYNTLLAAMKRGKKFQNAGSTQWILEGSDTIAGSSILTKSAKKARDYLQGVIRKHPKTPWAEMARLELETPIGWKWTEQ